MKPLHHALAMAWLLDKLDGDGTIEFNTFHPDGHVQANQVDLARLRAYPYETFGKFLYWSDVAKSKISIGVNLRRHGILPKDFHGLPYDGFGVKADIIQCAAFFQDADLPNEAVELQALIDYDPQPSLIVSSSPGRYHAYWKLAHPLDITSAADIAKYESVQKGIANFFGFKPMNIRQVMGLAGTFNRKYDPPILREVVYQNTANLYDNWEDFPMALTVTPSPDVGLELYHDGKIPQDAVKQLANPTARHGGRSNALFAVSIWLRDLGFDFGEVQSFIVNTCRSLAIYSDFPTRDIQSAVKSAFRS